MKKNTRTGSRLFFIEFLIVLFFFLIIGTVCLRIFVQAHRMTEGAEALSQGQSLAASVAEVLEGGAAEPEVVASYFPGAEVSEKGIAVYYDRDYQPCDREKAYYILTVDLETGGGEVQADTASSEEAREQESREAGDREVQADIAFSKVSGEEIYGLSVMIYIPLTKEEVLP